MIPRISWRQTGRVAPLRRRGGHRRACSVQTWQPGMQPGRCADLFGCGSWRMSLWAGVPVLVGEVAVPDAPLGCPVLPRPPARAVVGPDGW